MFLNMFCLKSRNHVEKEDLGGRNEENDGRPKK